MVSDNPIVRSDLQASGSRYGLGPFETTVTGPWLVLRSHGLALDGKVKRCDSQCWNGR